jgi:hypothetical protein
MRDYPQHLLDKRFAACVLLSPQGDHRLEVSSALGEASFTRDQVKRLKEAIAEYEREVMFEDGRPVERHRPERIEIAERVR